MKSDTSKLVLDYYKSDLFSSPFLSSQDKVESVIKELQKLFFRTDWRIVYHDNFVDLTYNNIDITSFAKALSLPYILFINSERELSRALIKFINLRLVCGFPGTESIGKRTFWHFRDKFRIKYDEFVIRSLTSLALESINKPFNLPFVKITEKHPDDLELYKEIRLNNDLIINIFCKSTKLIEYRKRKFIVEEDVLIEYQDKWRTELTKIKADNPNNLNLWREKYIEFEEGYQKLERTLVNRPNFFVDLLPFYVQSMNYGQSILLEINKPNSRKDKVYKSIYRTNEEKENYSAACNLLLIREGFGETEILLSRRKGVEGKTGPYAIPGGKKEREETLKNCASRELREETNLILKDSYIIDFKRDKSGNEDVYSFGILVKSYEGELKTLETKKHVGWHWVPVSILPEDIFKHSKRVIDKFIQHQGKKIMDWEEAEIEYFSEYKQDEIFE